MIARSIVRSIERSIRIKSESTTNHPRIDPRSTWDRSLRVLPLHQRRTPDRLKFPKCSQANFEPCLNRCQAVWASFGVLYCFGLFSDCSRLLFICSFVCRRCKHAAKLCHWIGSEKLLLGTIFDMFSPWHYVWHVLVGDFENTHPIVIFVWAVCTAVFQYFSASLGALFWTFIVFVPKLWK